MAFEWFSNLFNPFLDPLLNLKPIYILLIVSFAIAFISTIIYKYVTNQKLMKSIRDEMKAIQKEMKTLKGQPEKQAELQKSLMQKNMPMFRESMKANLFTIIPASLIFLWLLASLTYEPIMPSEVFTVELEFIDGFVGDVTLEPDDLITTSNLTKAISDGKVLWALSGEEGMHILEFNYTGDIYEKKVLITNDQKYEPPVSVINNKIKQITVSNSPLKPLGKFNLFGWYPSWIWIYIILTIALNILARKLLKVH